MSIVSKIDEVFKTNATARLLQYLQEDISKAELDAIGAFRPKLLRFMNTCSQGRSCVWFTGDVIRDTYNDIARVKHIPILVLNNGLPFEHVSPPIIDITIFNP